MADITVVHLRGGRFVLRARVELPQPIEQVFPFFSDAHNLEELTPPWLAFRILTPDPIEIREDLELDYRLRVRGIPLRWTSRIESWQPPHGFRDSQIRGPYRRWEHEHLFTANGDTTVARDRVDFEVLGGYLPGRLVARDVRRIFEYRQARLQRLFGEV